MDSAASDTNMTTTGAPSSSSGGGDIPPAPPLATAGAATSTPAAVATGGAAAAPSLPPPADSSMKLSSSAKEPADSSVKMKNEKEDDSQATKMEQLVAALTACVSVGKEGSTLQHTHLHGTDTASNHHRHQSSTLAKLPAHRSSNGRPTLYCQPHHTPHTIHKRRLCTDTWPPNCVVARHNCCHYCWQSLKAPARVWEASKWQ